MGSALSAMRETHSDATTLKPSAVAELQGLYGAFTFPERLLQQIWQRSDYDTTHAHTADGRLLKIRYPGRWNHLGGPDFAGARLNIGGQEISGDVELHLNAQDWYAHGHASNPTYDNVILHVVLFPCEEACTAGAHGQMIPILCLLPRLHHGLEEYAADAAIEQLAGRPLHRAQEKLGLLSNRELDTVLRDHAQCSPCGNMCVCVCARARVLSRGGHAWSRSRRGSNIVQCNHQLDGIARLYSMQEEPATAVPRKKPRRTQCTAPTMQ